MTRPSNQPALLAETTIDQKNKKKQKKQNKTKNKLDIKTITLSMNEVSSNTNNYEL